MRSGIFPSQPVSEAVIKTFFYNALAEYVLDHGDVTNDDLQDKIRAGIIQVFGGIITASKDQPGIRLPTGRLISLQECPLRYKPLFAKLIELKNQEKNPEVLDALAQAIMAMDSYKEIDPEQYIREMTGLAAPVLRKVAYGENEVTTDLTRDTFYNEMWNQAMLATQEQWLLLSVKDLIDEESHIFWALPALTILEAIQQSQNCDGIRLLKDKMVTMRNCPKTDGFPDLVTAILKAKALVRELSADELYVVKHRLACENPLPEHLQPIAEQDDIKAIVKAVKSLAFEISRRRTFCEMVGQVVTRAVEILQPDALETSPKMRV